MCRCLINVIIGWEGIGTMEQSYSNYTITQINDELNKFSYDFLQDEFKYWKKVMEKKQLCSGRNEVKTLSLDGYKVYVIRNMNFYNDKRKLNNYIFIFCFKIL